MKKRVRIIPVVLLVACGKSQSEIAPEKQLPVLAPSASVSAIPTSAPATEIPRTPLVPEMVRFPAGRFYQGSAGATGDDFAWQHWDEVPEFLLDRTEVTVQAYRRCIAAGVCKYEKRSDECSLARDPKEYANDPVDCVTYEEAAQYCAFREAILPTDAMWEYAAGGRLGRTTPFAPGLNEKLDRFPPLERPSITAVEGMCRDGKTNFDAYLPTRIQYRGKTTCPVESFPLGNTPEGLADMAGNVSEWTSTVYCKHHKALCEANQRTVKGSSYDIRSRHGVEQTAFEPNIGFRCAKIVSLAAKPAAKPAPSPSKP